MLSEVIYQEEHCLGVVLNVGASIGQDTSAWCGLYCKCRVYLVKAAVSIKFVFLWVILSEVQNLLLAAGLATQKNGFLMQLAAHRRFICIQNVIL